MPQMMPLLWIINLFYATIMINMYIIMTHYTNYSFTLNPALMKLTPSKMKINYKW